MPTTNPAVTGIVAIGQIPYTNLGHHSGPSVVLGSNNLWWEASVSRFAVGLNGVTPSAKVHVVGDGAPAAQPLALRVDTGPVFMGDIALSTYTSEGVHLEVCPPAGTSRNRAFRLAPGALTAISGGELRSVQITPANVQFSGVGFADQNAVYFDAPTYSFTTAQTLTSVATVRIAARPIKGTNATWGTTYYANSFGLVVSGGTHLTAANDGLATPPPVLSICRSALTGIQASYEVVDVVIGGNTTTWAGAAPATQRMAIARNVTYASTGPTTISNAATFAIEGAPIAGTNVTISAGYAFWVQGGASQFDGAVSLVNGSTLKVSDIAAPTGAGGKITVGTVLTVDQTNLRIGINSTGPDRGLDVRSGLVGGIAMGVLSTSNTGYGAILFRDDAIASAGSVGYGNSGVADIRGGRCFFTLNGKDFIFSDSTTKILQFIRRSDGFVGVGDITAPAGMLEVKPTVATTGSPVGVQLTAAAHTTLSNAETIDLYIKTNRTVQFGQNTALATQRTSVIEGVTYSSSAATKTITDGVTLDITAAPTAGTNVAITNKYALRVAAGATKLAGQVLVGAINITADIQIDVSQVIATSGVPNILRLVGGAHTGLTASADINDVYWNLNRTVQRATGAVASSAAFLIDAPSYSFVGASTITAAATIKAGAPAAGTNATITNSYAAWFTAKIRVDSAAALGGGAAPTLGTIGGAGPATAAQNEWIAIDTQNGKRWVPAWA